MDPEHPQIRRSLKASVYDGSLDAAKIGFGESFFSAFALLLGATPFQIALLGSIPQFLSSVAQIFSEQLVRYYRSRKNVVLVGATIQAITLIPLLAAAYFGRYSILIIMLLVSIYFVSGKIVSPIWNSWMADLVSDNRRGAYFGRRNKFIGFSTFLAFIIAGIILALAREHFNAYVGFFVLFLLAAAARFLSVAFLTQKHDPILDLRKIKKTTIGEFFHDAKKSEFGRLMYYLVSNHFFVFIAAPFFAVYVLSFLQLPYWHFALITGATFIAKSISMPVWGRAADRFGSRRILVLAGMVVGLVPLSWLVSTNTLWLIFTSAFSGFIWAGLDIASSNSLFERTVPGKRTAYLAYFNMCQGIAIVAGALVGSWIVKVGSFPTTVYFLVFVVSGVGRFLSAAVFLPFVKEARRVMPIGYKELMMHVVTASNPTTGLIESIPLQQQRVKESKLWMLFFDKKKYTVVSKLERARKRRNRWNDRYLVKQTKRRAPRKRILYRNV